MCEGGDTYCPWGPVCTYIWYCISSQGPTGQKRCRWGREADLHRDVDPPLQEPGPSGHAGIAGLGGGKEGVLSAEVPLDKGDFVVEHGEESDCLFVYDTFDGLLGGG